jgi:hypothetical protein
MTTKLATDLLRKDKKIASNLLFPANVYAGSLDNNYRKSPFSILWKSL